MSVFLPAPQDATFRFRQPRSNVEAQSRVTYTRYSGVGLWEGSMTYAPMRDPGPLMVELQKADKVGGAFFVDLRKDAAAVAGVSPTWGDAGKQFADSIEVPSSLQVRNGDLVSLRSSLSPAYVTARMIESWQQLGSTTRINFNAAIPTEFLTTAQGARLQYSINRPHVRAIFEEDTLRWRRDPDRLSASPRSPGVRIWRLRSRC